MKSGGGSIHICVNSQIFQAITEKQFSGMSGQHTISVVQC